MTQITREQFMEYFRSDRFNEEMSADDCLEIFKQSMKGIRDFTVGVINDVLGDYNVGNIVVFDTGITKDELQKLLDDFEIKGIAVVDAKPEQTNKRSPKP